MAGIVTPLSRRPWKHLLVLLPIGLLLVTSVLGAINSPKHFPNTEWIPALYLLAFAGIFYWNVASLAVTDYDADYLYLFQKTGTKQIPLDSFYKLVEARGWQLYYLDEHQQKQKLHLIPLSTSWFKRNDNSSIHGFIDAVWQHNPQLDVKPNWLR